MWQPFYIIYFLGSCVLIICQCMIWHSHVEASILWGKKYCNSDLGNHLNNLPHPCPHFSSNNQQLSKGNSTQGKRLCGKECRLIYSRQRIIHICIFLTKHVDIFFSELSCSHENYKALLHDGCDAASGVRVGVCAMHACFLQRKDDDKDSVALVFG